VITTQPRPGVATTRSERGRITHLLAMHKLLDRTPELDMAVRLYKPVSATNLAAPAHFEFRDSQRGDICVQHILKGRGFRVTQFDANRYPLRGPQGGELAAIQYP
jgi:hypothetical protein